MFSEWFDLYSSMLGDGAVVEFQTTLANSAKCVQCTMVECRKGFIEMSIKGQLNEHKFLDKERNKAQIGVITNLHYVRLRSQK